MAAGGPILFRCSSETDKQGQFSVLQVSCGLSVDMYTTRIFANKCFKKEQPAHGIIKKKSKQQTTKHLEIGKNNYAVGIYKTCV